jgi:hypothetical protein
MVAGAQSEADAERTAVDWENIAQRLIAFPVANGRCALQHIRLHRTMLQPNATSKRLRRHRLSAFCIKSGGCKRVYRTACQCWYSLPTRERCIPCETLCKTHPAENIASNECRAALQVLGSDRRRRLSGALLSACATDRAACSAERARAAASAALRRSATCSEQRTPIAQRPDMQHVAHRGAQQHHAAHHRAASSVF